MFIANHGGMDVGQTGTTHTRRQSCQTLFIDIKSVDAAGGFHQRTQRQRFTARAGAEVANHFAAFGLN